MGGQKRLRNGDLKASRTQLKKSQLEGAVQELGGDQADLELIGDALSGSELEGERRPLANHDGKLKQDLSRMVTELGFHGPSTSTKKPQESSKSRIKQGKGVETPKIIVKQSHTDKAENKFGSKVDASRPNGKLKKKVVDRLVFEPAADWHAVDLPPIQSSGRPASPLKELPLVQSIHAHARSLLEAENERYRETNEHAASSNQFYSTIVSSGTLSDKISALTLSVQESPLHNIRALESLLTLAGKRSRSQAVEVLGALKDLFASGSLLPTDRRLRNFGGQPGLLAALSDFKDRKWTPGQRLPASLKELHLITWAFEDWLKTKYLEVIRIIETWSHDEISFARTKSVDYVYQLLKDRPEQEDNLLRLLVNKLGDPEKKIASRASYNILQLMNAHPAMKHIIISAIENDLLFRPNQNLHAQYYASITLNQTVLTSSDITTTTRLLDIYFALFKQLLTKPEVSEPKPVVINRKGEIQGGGSAPGKAAIKKAKAEEKKVQVNEELKEKMISAILTGVNRAVPYTDTNQGIFEKHIDTLFKITHSSNFNTAVQALILIQQIQGNNQKVVDRFYRTLYESLLDLRLSSSSKQTLYLNLLFRALKNDLNIKRVKAFVKRLIQVISTHQPPFTCATLYLTRELESTFASLRTFTDDSEEDQSDEEEHYQDVGEEDDQTKDAFGNYDNGRMALRKDREDQYDGRKRDPEYCNADKSSLWELSPLITHFHPSVALFASRLLHHEPMPPKPDLEQNTLMHFLDRFVYRNPKQSGTQRRGPSVMQPVVGTTADHISISERSGLQHPVNSSSFGDISVDKIKPDEVFFHKYFSATSKGRKPKKEKQVKKRRDVDDSDDEGGEDEDEVWKALVNSRPELDEAEDSDGEEMDLDGFGSDGDSGEEEGFSDASFGGDEDGDADSAFDDAFGISNDDEAVAGSTSKVDMASDEDMEVGEILRSMETRKETAQKAKMPRGRSKERSSRACPPLPLLMIMRR